MSRLKNLSRPCCSHFFQLRLTYDDGAVGAPASLILKAGLPVPCRRPVDRRPARSRILHGDRGGDVPGLRTTLLRRALESRHWRVASVVRGPVGVAFRRNPMAVAPDACTVRKYHPDASALPCCVVGRCSAGRDGRNLAGCRRGRTIHQGSDRPVCQLRRSPRRTAVRPNGANSTRDCSKQRRA